MLQGKRIAVVIPAFNEEERIGSTVATLPGFVDLVIVVDDASVDATSARARDVRTGVVVETGSAAGALLHPATASNTTTSARTARS